MICRVQNKVNSIKKVQRKYCSKDGTSHDQTIPHMEYIYIYIYISASIYGSSTQVEKEARFPGIKFDASTLDVDLQNEVCEQKTRKGRKYKSMRKYFNMLPVTW